MKSYMLTAEFRVNDNIIKKAREWEKKKNFDYKDDVAHLLTDCITDGEFERMEVEEADLYPLDK